MKKKVIAVVAILVIAIAFVMFSVLAEDDLDLNGAVVAVLIGEGYNEQEAGSSIEYLEARGVEVIIAGVELTTVTPYDRVRVSREIEVLVKDINLDEIDALVVPGGYAANNLARDDDVISLVREVVESGKPLAAICTGPIVLAEADVVQGRTVTSQSGLQNAFSRANANWISSRVVVDENIITSRRPRDLRFFNAEIGIILRGIIETKAN